MKNIIWSHSSANNQINNISDHDNFFLEYNWEQIKIYPELVETTEHVMLWLEKNLDFKQKIMNAEYDMLVWDDVSGRTVTLLIKHIIDHFRKEQWLKWWIDNIFIDDVSIFSKQFTNIYQKDQQEWYINVIIYHLDKLTQNFINNYVPSKEKKWFKKKYRNKRNILVCTEYINSGDTINGMNKIFSWDNTIDVFSQAISTSSIAYIREIRNVIYWVLNSGWNSLYPKTTRNCYDSLWIQSRILDNNWFSRKKDDADNEKIKKYRLAIKLLADYIIKHNLS